jgi:uncharacterized NAD-dependent epimerase/dehydratase family protein
MINAIIYCERGLLDPLGKTAHGLIRYSKRYRIVGVVDSSAAGGDAGDLLDGRTRQIPVFTSIEIATKQASPRPDVMVVGLAPTGFRGERAVVQAAKEALKHGLSVHSGLHLFLSELPQIRKAAVQGDLEVLDIRRPPSRRLQMLSGKILDVKAPRLLLTGQDAAVGKRTAAIRLRMELESRGVRVCLIGTGQTAWLQGVDYGVRLDALPLDFAGGELEAEIVRAYEIERPDLFLIEGQGSLLNPGYSCETMILLTACRPALLVYVSAPGRSRYVDFPRYKVRSAEEELALLEAISGAQVAGIIVHCHHSEVPDPLPLRQGLPQSIGADGDLGPIVDRIVNSLAHSRPSHRQ